MSNAEKIALAKEDLLERVRITSPKANLKKVALAFDMAAEAHKHQVRASGEPYIFHPIAVAEILTELKLDTDTIITALLHDTVEDTNLTKEDIEKNFGASVAYLVEGVTKLAKIEYQPEHVKQAENFRKLLVAISEDIRVLLVKLADRLHNMRTIKNFKSHAKRIKVAHETMEIYAPLAERIGIHKFKNELQDLAFAELYPEIRKSILSRLDFLRKKGGSLVESIISELNEKISKVCTKAVVNGREKTSCAIWRKMEHKNVTFEQLADIIAFRVLVNNVQDCYKVLGIIHANYHMIPGGFKDFISTPKNNGYQSLHTLVMGPEQRCIEIQIRTFEMHEVAEYGVAAHWMYKQKIKSGNEGTQFRWVRELLEILENASSAEEFLENTKLEMYYDQVFCFTPKGELHALPKSSTPVDFAFAVHSDVGIKCIGAKVNGRMVPLKTVLENGDQVEILCAKNAEPSPSWEKFVVTGKARAEIKKYIRSKQSAEYEHLGRALLIKIFQMVDLKYSDAKLKPAIEHYKKDSIRDILSSVGDGSIDRNELMKFLYPHATEVKKTRNPLSLLRFKSSKTSSKKVEKSLPIKGLIPGMAIHFATCCNPLPGDKIVGIVNTGKGIAIHTADCDMLESFASTPERWIDVSWDGVGEGDYISKIKMTILNEVGSFAKISQCIANERINISNMKMLARSIDFFEIIVDIEVKGVSQLSNLITTLRSIDCVHSVDRFRS